MIFNSAIFLFAFLPLLFILYRAVPGIRGKNLLLSLFSLVFYAFGSLSHLLLLLGSVLVNWAAGRLMEIGRGRKAVLVTALGLNIGLLAVFKYLDFFIGVINECFGLALPLAELGLPVGISFFTFAGMSYLLEVGRDPEQKAAGFGQVLLFMCLFPTLVAGPILNYKDFSPQLDDRRCTPEKTARGIRRFVVGLAKKLLVADVVAGFVDAVFACAEPDARLVWLAAAVYCLQIYFDFSGCSDMAIGAGAMFGFELPENFRMPYASASVTEFWSRWHMSLTGWFRRYVYYPLTMSRGLRRIYRRCAGKGRQRLGSALSSVIALAAVWLLTGLWHGPSWCFVLWGLWHGLWNILEGVGAVPVKRLSKTGAGRVLLHIYTLLVVLLGSVLFRSADLGQAGQMFAAMFGAWEATAAGTFLLRQKLSALRILALVAAVGGAGLLPWLKKHSGRWGEPLSYVLCAGLFVLCVMCMAGGGFQPFIYAQL